MLVIIKSAPGGHEALRGLKVAEDGKADLVLLQDGVYLAQADKLFNFTGTAYVLEEDMKLRGVNAAGNNIRPLGYDELVDLMAGEEKVIGMF